MNNDSIIIRGGKKLNGEVRISGSKNATVALIPATVLATNVVTICDVPEISDVDATRRTECQGYKKTGSYCN